MIPSFLAAILSSPKSTHEGGVMQIPNRLLKEENLWLIRDCRRGHAAGKHSPYAIRLIRTLNRIH
jgi:hypothetical protein